MSEEAILENIRETIRLGLATEQEIESVISNIIE